MESIDAFSNSDLLWLLFGSRVIVKLGAFISSNVCYHTFQALKEKRLAEFLAELTSPTTTTKKDEDNVDNNNDNSEKEKQGNQKEEEESFQKSQSVFPTKTKKHDRSFDEEDLSVIRRLNLGLDISSVEKMTSTSTETSIRDFPLLTARRSLTSFLDYLAPFTLLGETLSICLECGTLWGLSHVLLGPVNHNNNNNNIDDVDLSSSTSSADFSVSTIRRWARRFVSGPPVYLRKVFGENEMNNNNNNSHSNSNFSLVANSLLGAILYRDSLAFAAIPLVPFWLGNLVTPMCVRFNFVASDLRDHMTMKDVKSIALAHCVRSICHSTAAIVQEIVVKGLERRRLRKRQEALLKHQQQQQGEKANSAENNKVSTTNNSSFSDFLPSNLFQGCCQDDLRLHFFAAMCNAFWAAMSDLTGFGSLLLIKKVFKPTPFRAQFAVTIARMVCQAATLTLLRVFARKLLVVVAPQKAITSSSSTNKKVSSQNQQQQQQQIDSQQQSPSIPLTSPTMYSIPVPTNNKNNKNEKSPSTSSSSAFSNKTPQQQQQQQQSTTPPPSRSSTTTTNTSSTAKKPSSGDSKSNNAANNNNSNNESQNFNVTPLRKTVVARLGHGINHSHFHSSTSPNNASSTSPSQKANANANNQNTLSATSTLNNSSTVNSLNSTNTNRNALSLLSDYDNCSVPASPAQVQYSNPVQSGMSPVVTSPQTVFSSSSETTTNINNSNCNKKPAFPESPVLPAQNSANSASSSTNPNSLANAAAASSFQAANMKQQQKEQTATKTTNLSSSSSSLLQSSKSFQISELNRQRLLQDLDSAFGQSSALNLSHIGEAVHSMLSSLQPDNNCRIHALLYLAAVDEYVNAVNHGELSRNFQEIKLKRQQMMQMKNQPTFSEMRKKKTTTTTPSSSSSSSVTSSQQQQQKKTPPIVSPPSSSTSEKFALPPPSLRLSLPASSSSSSNLFNIHEHSSSILYSHHIFTQEEISERKQLVKERNSQQQQSHSHHHPHSTLRPFYCVACKYTFKANQKAIILPCQHLIHDECGSRLRSDWCPRCSRPFEQPASSDVTIRDYHDAYGKLGFLMTRWMKFIFLPPHLWFSEWRRVRQFVLEKFDRDGVMKQEQLLEYFGGDQNNNTIKSENLSVNNANNNNISFVSETWTEAVVASQIIFAVPDDFSPSALGIIDVPIMAALSALNLLAFSRHHEKIVAMIHESMVDGANNSTSSTTKSRGLSFANVKC